jgi:RNA polymerase sigma-70 factor (ECF subfamily)
VPILASATVRAEFAVPDAPQDPDTRRASFLRLAKASEEVLVRVAGRLVPGDTEAALDIVQETIVAAYSGFMEGRLDDPARFRPWILQILRHKAHAEWRRSRRTRSFADLTALIESSQEPGGAYGPDQAAEQTELARLLHSALDTLPPDQRATVELVDIGGLEYRDAAAVLGVAIGTVRSRLARARWKLAAVLNGAEGLK